MKSHEAWRSDQYFGEPPDKGDLEPPPVKITVITWEAYGPSPGCNACKAGGQLFSKNFHSPECRRRFSHLHAGRPVPLPKVEPAPVASGAGPSSPRIFRGEKATTAEDKFKEQLQQRPASSDEERLEAQDLIERAKNSPNDRNSDAFRDELLRKARARSAAVATSSTNCNGYKLPEPWKETWDPNTGDPYYYNTITNEVRWNRPTMCEAQTVDEKTAYFPGSEEFHRQWAANLAACPSSSSGSDCQSLNGGLSDLCNDDYDQLDVI